MPINYFAPSWFLGYDIALQLIFAVISLVLSAFAFGMFKKTEQRQAKLFGFSFLFISISYFIQSIFNFLILSKLNQPICGVVNLPSVATWDYMGAYTHMIFMSVGLLILLYMTFGIKDKRVLAAMVAFSMLALALSSNAFYTFYLISTISLLFISWHFIKNYFNKKKTLTLLVAVAFVFLLFGNIHFLLSVNHPLFYAIGHILEFVAYILILINFYMVLKK